MESFVRVGCQTTGSNHLRLHGGDGSERVGPDAGARWLPGTYKGVSSLGTQRILTVLRGRERERGRPKGRQNSHEQNQNREV